MTEKLALTGRMTSVIAHEINNPLEAIGNLLYLLSSKVSDDVESVGYVRLMESELLRISAITKQTLRWSNEGVKQAEYGTAGDLFADVLRLYAGKIRNREVKVTVGGQQVGFYGKAGQLAQVLANLVANAIQAVPVGGTFSLQAFDEGETMSIVVRDQGHGMDRDTLQKIFEPFFTTKEDLGNGLGLYISKEIVERHGGSLTVHSEIGVGTEMRVRLPTAGSSSRT